MDHYLQFFLIAMMLLEAAAPPARIEEFTPSQLDANGEQFVILHGDEYAIFPDELNGEIVNDAQYEAKMRVAELYNVLPTDLVTTGRSPEDMVTMSIMAADPICDIVLADAKALGVRASQGMFWNLSELPGLTLDGVWWNDALNSRLEVGEQKLYLAANDISPANYDSVACMLYDYDLYGDAPLELAKEGKWTLERLLELTKACELPGVSFTRAESAGAMLYGAGADFLDVTEDTVQITGLTTELFDAADLISELLGLDNKEMSAMAVGTLGDVKKIQYREMSDLLPNIENVRVVPLPKLSEDDDYASPITDSYELLAVPIYCMDTLKTGTVLDALQYYSHTIVQPARHNLSALTKYKLEAEVIDGIELIEGSLTLDERIPYNCAIFAERELSGAIESGTLASSFVMNEAKMQSLLDKALAVYNE